MLMYVDLYYCYLCMFTVLSIVKVKSIKVKSILWNYRFPLSTISHFTLSSTSINLHSQSLRRLYYSRIFIFLNVLFISWNYNLLVITCNIINVNTILHFRKTLCCIEITTRYLESIIWYRLFRKAVSLLNDNYFFPN